MSIPSTTANISGFFNTLYEEAMFVLRDTVLMPQLVTNYTGEGIAPRNQGIYPSVSAVEVAEGIDFSAATAWTKASKMSLTPKINKAQIVITQAQIDTDPDDALRDASTELGNALATKLDTDIVGTFASFTTDTGTANVALSMSDVGAGMAILRNNKARAPFYCVLHPYGWHDIWLELGKPAANQTFLGDVANEALRAYYVSNQIGAMWFTSANISVDASDDAVGAVFTEEAIALDTRKSPTFHTEGDPSIAGYGWEINGETIYAVGLRRGEHGVKFTHDASTPS